MDPPMIHARINNNPPLSLIARRINLQGEHKFFPRLQIFITRKLRGLQTYIFYHHLS